MQDAALNEAKQSRHQAKAATVLAFVAMIYLPSSTVATIFAMPIFDWQARWWDIHAIFEAQASADSASPSENQTAGDPGPAAVLSGYFWIYFSVSLFLTFLTVAICFFYISDWAPVINFFSSIWTAMKSLYGTMKITIVGGSGGSMRMDDERPVLRKGTFKLPDGTPLMEIRRSATTEPPTSTAATLTINPTIQVPVAGSDISPTTSPPQAPDITPSPSPGTSLLSLTSTSTAQLPPPPCSPNTPQHPLKQPPTPATTLRSIVQAVAERTTAVTSTLATSAAIFDSMSSPTVTSTRPATVPVSISQASPKGHTALVTKGSSSSTIANSSSTAATTS